MRRETVDECIRRNLELLREATASDCAFLVVLRRDELVVEDVQVARSAFAQCRPEGLRGALMDTFPWLKSRLDHLRLSELRDTSAPRREQTAEAQRLAELQIGSALLVALRVQGQPAGFLGLCHTLPRGAWDVNLQLLMKLIGTSLATGLERIRIETRLAKLEERTTALAGLRERRAVGFRRREQRGLLLAALEGDARLCATRTCAARPTGAASCIRTICRACRPRSAITLPARRPMFESTHRMRHRNGEWRWVISRATARVDKHGRLLRLVGVELDITERKLYEEALFREKESAQITLQSIGDGVITTDANSTIDYINPVAEELTGWRLEDAMGRPVEEIFRAFHEETCEPLENPLERLDPAHPADQVRAADAAHPPRRQRAVRREHGRADPRRRGPRGRRRAGVP